MSEEKKTKSQETIDRILDASLKLFLEEGYEKATMRSIAREAGMSLGAAYYYFPTKEHIIFEFYTRTCRNHLGRVNELLQTEPSLEHRIAGVTKAQIDDAQPYHKVSRALFRVAVDPRHTLSPFSEESRELRELTMSVYRRAIDDASLRGFKIPATLDARLPELLWFYRMVIIFYWLFDDSERTEKTYRLIDLSAAMIVKMIRLAGLPVARGIVAGLLKLFDEFKPYR